MWPPPDVEEAARRLGHATASLYASYAREAANVIQVLEATQNEPFASQSAEVAWPGEVDWGKANSVPLSDASIHGHWWWCLATRSEEAHVSQPCPPSLFWHPAPAPRAPLVPEEFFEMSLEAPPEEAEDVRGKRLKDAGAPAALGPEQVSTAARAAVAASVAREGRRSTSQCCAGLSGPLLALTIPAFLALLPVIDRFYHDGHGFVRSCSAESTITGPDAPWAPNTRELVRTSELMASCGVLVLVVPAVVWLLLRSATSEHQCLAVFAWLVWLQLWLVAARKLDECDIPERSSGIFKHASALASVACVVIFHVLVLTWAYVLEANVMRSLGVFALGIVQIFLGVLSMCALASHWATKAFPGIAALPHVRTACCWACVAVHFCCCLLAPNVFRKAKAIALAVSQESSGRRASEAREAARVLREQMLGSFVGLATSGVMLTALLLEMDWMEPSPSAGSVSGMPLVYSLCFGGPPLLDGIAKILGALCLGGAFSGAVRASAASCAATRRQRASRAAFAGPFLRSWASKYNGALSEGWQDKVYELAGRGFTLEALLQFYRGLGSQFMLHYDASRHTTVDVVRQAIIPLSAKAGSSYAQVMMHGRHTRPRRMVTHTWSGLFVDLVAAIVADALEEAEYAHIADLLRHDASRVETWVRQRGKHLRTYWVCAFSVNQHRSICASDLGDGGDTVSGVLHPACRCGLGKAWHNAEPALDDGRGIECETNKFHDMLRFLSATDPGFAQVVAVDAQLGLLGRAWCVSELALAHEIGLVQHIKLCKAESLGECMAAARSLRIEEAKSTQLEDEKEILARIQDVAAFDERVQTFLCKELLPAWQDTDQTEHLVRLGRIALWRGLLHEQGRSQ